MRKETEKLREKFKFHDDYGLDLPLLVLAIGGYDNFPYEEYRFKKTRKFLPLQHQTAGMGCHQHYMYATVLTPREPDKIRLIAKTWLDSNAGVMGVSLSEILEYRTMIKNFFNADCEMCYQDFEEGIYPLDLEKETLAHMAMDTNLPEDLDDLVIWNNKLHKLCGCMFRWRLFILGENCD